MNKRLIKKSRERKYSVNTSHMYVAISKKTGKFLRSVDYRNVLSWAKVSDFRNFVNYRGVNLSDFFLYRLSTIDKEPHFQRVDKRGDPKIRKRNPMSENELHDFELLDKLTASPMTYEVYIDEDKVWFKEKERGKKTRKEENKDNNIYVFKENGNKLLNEMFHFLKLNSDEIQREEI